MSWIKASVATAIAQGFRMLSGLIVIKAVALALGPEGFGRIGHFMSLIAILGVMGGGGILNGIVKYVAEYHHDPDRLNAFLSNALGYTLVFSGVLFALIVVSANWLSSFMFSTAEYAGLIITLGALQFGYGLISFFNGTVNGLRETARFAKIAVIGTLLSLPISCYLIMRHGFEGAVVGLAMLNAMMILPAFNEFRKLKVWRVARLRLEQPDVGLLGRFSLMQMASLCTLPLAEIYVRSIIIDSAGWHAAGIWQSLMRLSSVYVGFFTTFLAAYYMPTLSRVTDHDGSVRLVLRYIAAVGAAFAVVAVFVYAFREVVFAIIFSSDFVMRPSDVMFQLTGDLFKLMAYVVGFLVVAKAKTWLYIGGELVQTLAYAGLAIGAMHFRGPDGVYAAYALSNFIYFAICFAGLMMYRHHSRRLPILKELVP